MAKNLREAPRGPLFVVLLTLIGVLALSAVFLSGYFAGAERAVQNPRRAVDFLGGIPGVDHLGRKIAPTLYDEAENMDRKRENAIAILADAYTKLADGVGAVVVDRDVLLEKLEGLTDDLEALVNSL